MASTKVYNKGYDPSTEVGELIDAVSHRHALTMIHRGVADPVELTERGGEIVVVSVVLVRRIYAAWVERRRVGTVGFSTREVFERDNWTCAYCGNKVSKTPRTQSRLATVDHVHPRSQGGATNWLNLVSACFECNQRKKDLSLTEAGMALRFEPYDPNVSYRDVDGSVVEIAALVAECAAAA